MINAIELLKQDHLTVAALLEKIDKTTERVVKSRAELLIELKAALQLHEELEETYLYPVLKKHTETKDLAFEALEEHHVVDYLLKEIEKDDYDSKQWTAKFTVLKESVEHPVKEEENDLFPKTKKALSTEQLEDIGNKMNQLKAKKDAKLRTS